MGLFSRKDPAQEYPKHKKAYLDKISVQKNKNPGISLDIRKCIQEEQTTKIYLIVKQGCIKVGDLLQIPYVFKNKLGLMDVAAKIESIYQIQGAGRHETLVPTEEAYEADTVWIAVSGVDAALVDKQGVFRKITQKNTAAEGINEQTLSVSSDEEVSKMVNYFKPELYNYFAEGKSIGHITQDLSHALMVQRKRLERMGVTMEAEKSSDIGSAAIEMEVRRYSSSQYDVAEADEAVKLKRIYHRPGHVVYQDNDWRICHYLLAGAKYNNTGLIECPNCGSYAEREELLNGCPYCSTQFTIRDLSLRVAGYSQKKIEQTRFDKFRGKTDIGYALYHEGKQKEYDQVLKKRMQAVDPLFSPTAFYNSMRNKLYSIVFAESVTALKSLADEDFDVAPFYDKFRNVMDIDIEGIDTKNIKVNNPYILVDVIMTVMVLRTDEAQESAAWSKEKVTMSFVKHINNKTKNIFEPGKIQCATCGGSYSLYDGKACTYCGHEIDYLMYDWLLIDLALEI